MPKKSALSWPGRNRQYPSVSPFEEDDYPVWPPKVEPEEEEDKEPDEEDKEDEQESPKQRSR